MRSFDLFGEQAGPFTLKAAFESWPLETPLIISFATLETIDVAYVEIAAGGVVGRGEGCGVFYREDRPEAGVRELQAAADALAAGAPPEAVYRDLTASAARNAFDCALWDLGCKLSGRTIWEATGVGAGPIETFATVSLGAPDDMAAAARSRPERRLKLKIDGTDPVGQVAAVRAARPDAELIADANQAFSFDQLRAVAASLAALDLRMLEQPLPAGADEALLEFDSPVPLCADESCFTVEDLPAVAGRYAMVNVKLDKTGGLTGGLALQNAAHARGLKTMIGCMAGTSLSMAPGFVIACNGADIVDLDGPVLLAGDRENGARYEAGRVTIPGTEFWG